MKIIQDYKAFILKNEPAQLIRFLLSTSDTF